jgi:hypothetical protein
MEKLRVLCLHGYRGNAQVLRRQLAPLANGLDGLVEFAYVDGPSLAAGDFGWWHAEAPEIAATERARALGAAPNVTKVGKKHATQSLPPLDCKGLSMACLASAGALPWLRCS